MKVLVTGAAGFIGSQTTEALLARGDEVVGLDNLNDYYDVNLKLARLKRIEGRNNFHFVKADLADRGAIEGVFSEFRPERVINLAAQAGVRYALQNPHAYMDANLTGFLNILEGCRHHGVEHLVYASSSSVYGANTKMPFSVHDNVDHPVSLYAASKKANELMAHSYAHLFRLPVTGLRFFTVYGPWGRPDMSLFLFTRNILAGQPIDVFNFGHHARDFTYIDDIVQGTIAAHDRPAGPGVHRIYNLGNHRPERLLDFIAVIERLLGRTATKQLLPMQPGDVAESFADIEPARRDLGFEPKATIETGLASFVQWYKAYHALG
jgi:UDP-glucuronate 4-epimerase